MTSKIKNLIAPFLLLSVVGLALLSPFTKTEAAAPCAVPPTVAPNPLAAQVQDMQTNITTSSEAFDSKAACIKDYIFDALAWTAANVAIQSITSSLVNWINSGFEGSPAFVQDLKGHFQDLANAAFEDMLKIFNVEDFVCSSFSARLRNSFEINLAINQGGGRNAAEKQFFTQAKCTVDDVLKNVDSTIEDFQNDFSKGGWEAWIEYTKPQNTELGATLKFNQELWRRQNEATENEAKELSFGGGFMSWRKKCSTYDSPDGKKPKKDDGVNYAPDLDADFVGGQDFTGDCTDPDAGQIQTPGSVIQGQLDQALGGAAGRLQVADEINEIIGAVMSQLVQQVMQKGLAGASKNDSGPSLTDQLRDERTDTSSLRDGLSDTASIDEYIGAKLLSISYIDSALTNLRNLLICYQEKNQTSNIQQTQQKISGLDQQKINLQSDISDANAYLASLQDTSNTGDIGAQARNYANAQQFNPIQAKSEQGLIQGETETTSEQAISALQTCRSNP